MAALAREHGPVVVYPGAEESIDALMANRDALGPDVLLPYPGPQPLESLRDKQRLRITAEGAGLKTPTTLLEGAAGELARGDLPAGGVLKGIRAGRALETLAAENEQELRNALSAFPPGEPVLVQELIRDAQLGSVELVVDRGGDLVARFQHLGRRVWPLHGGHVVESVSVEPDEELVRMIASMLASVGYWGLAQVQFLQRGSDYRVIDVNPRFYGPMPLALACGVNLPSAWHAVTTGRPFPGGLGSYIVGLSYRRLDADVTAAWRGSPGLLFQRTPAPKVGSVWAFDDPVPSFLLTGAALTGRVLARLPSRRGCASPSAPA